MAYALPCSVTINGTSVSVNVIPTSGRHHGEYLIHDRSINVHTVTPTGVEREERDILYTFWHEITHAILHDMGDKRARDEKFVHAFAARLNHVIHSARFE